MRRLFRWLLLLPVLIVSLVVTSAVNSWNKDESFLWVSHELIILKDANELLSAMQDLTIASRGYVLTNLPEFKALFEQADQRIAIESDGLSAVLEGDPQQKRRLLLLKTAGAELRTHSLILWSRAGVRKAQDIAPIVSRQKQALDKARHILREWTQEEKRQLEARNRQLQLESYISWSVRAGLFVVSMGLIFAVRRALSAYVLETDARLADLVHARNKAESAQQAAESARAIAEDALAARSRFLSTVSHEVRTPLSGVIGLVELIGASATKESETEKLAKMCLDSCLRLRQILDDLLDASKLQAGAVRLENRMFSLRPVIGDCVQLIGPDASRKDLEVVSVVEAKVPEFVYGDELRVRQIIQNLLFNAVKFTEQGSISLKVEVLSAETDRSTIKFSVTDTGIGIKEDQQEQLFLPFTQATESITRVHGGTGLGLSICRTLTELMSGTIGFESEYGKGSTFWVIIPFFLQPKPSTESAGTTV